MPSDVEEEDTGPSVDSADPEERIKARRIRIQKRIEAKRRYVLLSCSVKPHNSYILTTCISREETHIYPTFF